MHRFQPGEIVYVQYLETGASPAINPSKYEVVGTVNGHPNDPCITVKTPGMDRRNLKVFWYNQLFRSPTEATLDGIQRLKTAISKLRELLVADYKDFLGLTREELVQKLGEPDYIGGTSRKHKYPTGYKYGDIEYWFESSKDGKVHMIFDEKTHEVICKN